MEGHMYAARLRICRIIAVSKSVRNVLACFDFPCENQNCFEERMQTMKVVHVGLGEHGLGWCKAIHRRDDLSLTGIVDNRKETHVQASEFHVPCYLSLADALMAAEPDFIVNASPPHAHFETVKTAFLSNIPMLMEKPISEDFAEVLEMLKMVRNGQKLVIAENYRYSAQNIFAKEQLNRYLEGITSVNLVFRRHHHVPKGNYHASMKHPVIIDIGVHHFDLLRFFTCNEVRRVYAWLYTPSWSWYRGFSNAKLVANMDGGMYFNYAASLDSHMETSWFGEWTFTAENGTGFYDGSSLLFDIGGAVSKLDIPSDNGKSAKDMLLDEFFEYVRNGKPPQTDITDQANNAAIAEAAICSNNRGCAVDVHSAFL